MHKTQQELWKQIKKQGFKIQQIGYKDDANFKLGKFSYQYWVLPLENEDLFNGDFFYKGNYDFVHFTSISGMEGILTSQCIRLYNLVSMDDKFELEYGLRELKYPNEERLKKNFKKEKEELFCFSMCAADQVLQRQKIEHSLWKLHGRDGHGAMLRLEVENDARTWYQYHLSKVYYNTSNLEAVKQLHQTPDNNIYLDPKVSAFYKADIYDYEHEVRLVFDKRKDYTITVTDNDNKLVYPVVHPDKMKSRENVYFFELPLLNFYPSDSPLYKAPNVQGRDFEIPKIFISEIILGYRYSNEDYENIKRKIALIDPNIKVSITSLAEYF